MMEDHNQSYNDFLKKLSHHKAPGEVWDRLEASLFAVDVSLIPAYQAPEELWARIEKSASFRKRVIMWATALFLILSVSIPGYLLYNYDRSESTIQHHEQHLNIDNSASIIRSGMEISIIKPEICRGIIFEQNHTILINDHSSAHVMINDSEERTIPAISRMPIITADLNIINEYLILPRGSNDDCSPFVSSSEFMFGISYEYQHFISGDSFLETSQEFWHSFSFNTRLCFNKFYIESGAGLSLTKDKTNWSYNYIQNVLINSYDYVDSILYDPNTGETIFYTSIVEVYDSIPYSKSGINNRQSNYLKIPVLAGINLFQRKDFSTSLSGGFIYNLILSHNETKINYFEPESKITLVYYQETTRIQHCFNLTLRFNFEWHLNRKFIFYAYPSCNYYLNHLYDGKEGSNPLSFGIGAGIFLK